MEVGDRPLPVCDFRGLSSHTSLVPVRGARPIFITDGFLERVEGGKGGGDVGRWEGRREGEEGTLKHLMSS